MNDDLDRLQRALEQATAAGRVSADDLDAETCAMRETWLAFGQLLEASNSTGPQAGAGPKTVSPLLLGEGPGVKAAEASINRPMLPRKRANRWLLSAAGLLAASLLFAIATGWIVRSGQQQSLKSELQQTASTQSLATPSSGQPKNLTAADVPPWDDSLDEQFTQIDQQVLDARRDQFADAGLLTSIQYRIELMRQDIQADSL